MVQSRRTGEMRGARTNVWFRAVGTAALAVAGVLFAGCDVPAPDDSRERVYLNPLERDAQFARELEPPDPPMSMEGESRLLRVIPEFRKRADEVFEREDPELPIDEVERLYLSTGKYLQLVSIYQGVVERQGIESDAAPRLAWVLVRLGQDRQARELLDRLLEAQSENAMVHFVDGAYWFNRAPESREAAARAAVAWRRTLELDSEFEGPSRIDATALERRVRRVEERLPREPREILASSEGETRDGPPGESAAREAPTGGAGEEESEPSERARGDAATEPTPDAGGPAGAREDAGATGPEDAGRTPTPVLITRGDLALKRGNLDRAEKLYREVLDERGADRPDARFGMIRLRYRKNPHDPELERRLRSLLDDGALTAELAYEMGLFARAKLDHSELAEQFWQKVRELDPEYAERVGVGGN